MRSAKKPPPKKHHINKNAAATLASIWRGYDDELLTAEQCRAMEWRSRQKDQDRIGRRTILITFFKNASAYTGDKKNRTLPELRETLDDLVPFAMPRSARQGP